ncbi:MAG: hypothetical protein AAB425_11715 [Bdellovibrionota bacterium]
MKKSYAHSKFLFLSCCSFLLAVNAMPERAQAGPTRFETNGTAITRAERRIPVNLGARLAKNKTFLSVIRLAEAEWNQAVPGVSISISGTGIEQPGPGNARDEIWFSSSKEFFGDLPLLELTWLGGCQSGSLSTCRLVESDTIITAPLTDAQAQRAFLNAFSAMVGVSVSNSAFHHTLQPVKATLSPPQSQALLEGTGSIGATGDDLWAANLVPTDKEQQRPVRITTQVGGQMVAADAEGRHQVSRGGSYAGEFLVGNSSSTERTVVLGVYASTNSTVTTFDQRLLGVTQTIPPYTSQLIQVPFTLPGNLEAGRDYAIGLIIDEEGEISEINETNNATHISIRVN